MNRWRFHRNTGRLILVLASLLTLIVILITGMSSYAITPDGAYLGKIEGTGLTIGAGDSRDRKPATLQQKLRQNTILYVPGGNKPWAHLGFFQDSPLDSSGLLVKAGPSQIISEWSFPCSARGRFTIAWKKGSDRGCEAGVRVQSSSKKSGLPNNNLQASRKLLAQAEDEVTVVPTPGESVIQTADSAAGININVLVGDVRVKSAKNPEGRPVKAGERYDYPQDTITPIDINPIVNSPEMQDFLNPDNWRSPDIPQRIADGFSEQLGEMRTALEKGSPAVASNSGNNNNSNQSPTASNTSNNNNDLCGSGIITRRIVYSETSADRKPYSMWLDYTHGSDMGHPNCGRVHYDGNGSSGVYLVDGKGACVVTTPFEENPDGSLNSVPGKYNDCPIGYTPLPPSLVLSNQTNYCNSGTITQPTFSSNSHDGTPYRIWMDFSRGQEAISSAACGRQYWVKEYPNHPNYQIRFVYLVDGQGKCVVPYLYKETDGGTLEVVRQASECSSGSRPESVASNSSQQPSDLSGTWIARETGFTGNDKGCFAGYSGWTTVDGQDAALGSEFTMTQEGNQLRFPTQNVSYSNNTGSGSYTQSGNGTVSGNQVTITVSGGGFTTRSTGTISNDGNTVKGQSVCQYSGGSATANGSFTWTRKN